MAPELRLLTDTQLGRVYRERVKADFPPAERRPLASIRRLRAGGVYDTWGLFERERLLAYAFLWRSADTGCALLDYLAVDGALRGRGTGGRALELLRERYAGRILLAEAEAPSSDALPVENALRARRLDFYRRNGFGLLSYRTLIFGVDYAMLACPACGPEGEAGLQAAHRALYRSEFPGPVFRRMIHIPAERTDSSEYIGF